LQCSHHLSPLDDGTFLTLREWLLHIKNSHDDLPDAETGGPGKWFSRLSLGFSKKLGNLKAAVALHVFHYNFCRIHSSIRCTPAMRANLTDHIRKLDDLFGEGA